jgi:hypothetical protein
MALRGAAFEYSGSAVQSRSKMLRWLYGGGGGGIVSFSCVSSSTGTLARIASSLAKHVDIMSSLAADQIRNTLKQPVQGSYSHCCLTTALEPLLRKLPPVIKEMNWQPS